MPISPIQLYPIGTDSGITGLFPAFLGILKDFIQDGEKL